MAQKVIVVATGSRIGRTSIVAVLTAAVFALDTVTDLEIATAVFYIVVILIAIGLFSRRGVVRLAIACIALTLCSAALTKSGSYEAGLINSGISIAAIAITTWLALRMIAAEAAAYEARAQLIRIARVNSLGELAASIAHEVNQPLSAITTSGDACLRWLAADPPNLERARLAAGRIVDDASRAGKVVARVREHMRGEAAERREMSLNDVVAESVALAQSEIDRGGVTVRLDLTELLPPIQGDPIQLQQVLGNLILNAIEAMADQPAPSRSLDLRTWADNGIVRLCLGDAGIGVSEDNLPFLFDAFWTTKKGGTGMGLAICRTIVEAHGGTIRAKLGSPVGLEIHLGLPAAARS
ncbi:C4-dicarboxylate-specific signal transduction histidine kinase [Sphingobium sp. OAS761]|uniref:sensor histidine kinase n=1 Tax=Sphingobium sp. OAS761 TaxID=2817901 RepID=UPI0020A1A469|nr:ATP-binding protein [Sphingobium sp. OAS761]MCP1470682.1 C4-dicarboxylate-specific signal transduction histidine kinase [Sphingobium sp. OAS761]